MQILGISFLVRKILYTLVVVSLSVVFNFASAETFIARVIGISDGDTLTVLINEHEQIKVRLAEIDAPEKKQPYGQRSKQSLSNMCYQQTAVIERIDIDRYGRRVGKVLCGQVNANAEQIRKGMAWVYRKYLHDHSLLLLEQEAQVSRVGLWGDREPVPPWEWRKHSRHKIE